MFKKINPQWPLMLAGCLAPITLAHAGDGPRERQRLDDGWRFSLSDSAQAAEPAFDDSGWRSVTLPHDWSIEGKIDPKAPTGGDGGFFPSGVAWYRLSFSAPESWRGRRVAVEFEGVYMLPEIYLNGKKLYQQPYGYTSFFVELTEHLQPGAVNTLAVRVDNSRQKNSRWYSGSGIYRHVWLHVTNPVRVADWGVFVNPLNVSGSAASLAVKVRALNPTAQPLAFSVQTDILAPSGEKIGTAKHDRKFDAAGDAVVQQGIELANPPLWSPATPQLCRAVTTLSVSGTVVDRVVTPFGVRQLAWSAETGLTLNGQSCKLKGGCIHADNGVLGARAFDRAEERKIELLLAAGFNAIRTAHHPPSPALLDACDRLGMLVMDEPFDCWSFGKNRGDYAVDFKDWWQRDLTAMVLRDRNHPSVVMWSNGNEVPKMFELAEVAAYGPLMVRVIHDLDPSRPVTNGMNTWPSNKPEHASHAINAEFSWYNQDIVGTNYDLAKHVARHEGFPQRVLVSTESFPPYGEWQRTLANSWVIGDFVWSAQDYLGEAGIGRWFYAGDTTEALDRNGNPFNHGHDNLYPWHGSACGLIDINGESKPVMQFWNVLWQTGKVKLAAAVRQPESETQKIKRVGWGWHPLSFSWTWPGWEGKELEVEIYSTYAKTRLYLNDKLVEEKPAQYQRTIYKLPYAPGTLKVSGLEDGREVEETLLVTAGAPAALRLTPDRATIAADGQDLSFVKVEVVDARGNVNPNAAQLVKFSVSGPGGIAGLGNANLKGEEPYQGTECHVFQGKALVVLRGAKQAGALRLTAAADGLAPAEITVSVGGK